MDIWLLILLVFLATILLLYILSYILGYRLTNRKTYPNADLVRLSNLHRLETALAASQAAGRSAAAALSKIEDGVIIANSDYQVQYMNNAAGNIFGVLPDRWHGLTFIEIVRDHECNAVLKRCVHTNQTQASVIKLNHGRQVLNVAAYPETSAESYVVVVTDLTERQKIEQMRKDLVSNIAHEFRTPISSIKLLAETLLSSAKNNASVRADFLQKIDVEASKLQRMTGDLNELSMLDNGSVLSETSAGDIGHLIHQTVERLKTQAERKQIVISVDVEAGMPHPIIDHDGIESVLMNLIHNAIKYTGNGGRVIIKGVREGKSIVVSVADDGVGIPAEELPRVFERFYKVDKARNTEGSGLGLAIAKRIIALHGGTIWVESVEGKGSIFYFTLPLSA